MKDKTGSRTVSKNQHELLKYHVVNTVRNNLFKDVKQEIAYSLSAKKPFSFNCSQYFRAQKRLQDCRYLVRKYFPNYSLFPISLKSVAF